jgi:hypothetical protein
MNEAYFVSASGKRIIVKPKSVRTLNRQCSIQDELCLAKPKSVRTLNRKCSSQDELCLLSPKASTRSLLNTKSDHEESRRRSTIDENRLPVPPESQVSSRRVSVPISYDKTSAASRQTSGNELVPKSDYQGAAGRRRAARDNLANSDHTPKQAPPEDGLSNSSHGRPSSKREVLSINSNHGKKREYSRPRSSRDVLSTSGHGRRSGQSRSQSTAGDPGGSCSKYPQQQSLVPPSPFGNPTGMQFGGVHKMPGIAPGDISQQNQMINQKVSVLVNKMWCVR